MGSQRWKDVFDLPDEVDESEARRLYDSASYVVPTNREPTLPQITAKAVVSGLQPGEVLALRVDDIRTTANVRAAVKSLADSKVWIDDDQTCHVFLRRR